ncbi:MAG: hypothetical protein WCH99_03710 [Verrucomicrobiota bacterium]
MKELIAFILPPAMAFAGMRISRLVLGQKFEENFGWGLRFALGLAVGMVVFTQSVLLTALAGLNASGSLAWTALVWGVMEAGLQVPKLVSGVKLVKFQTGYLWCLLLLPVLYSWWVFGRLCTLEGTLEFDANAFWVFKSKIFYLEQGKDLLAVLHQPLLASAHMDYPMLVSCLYTLDYGAVGGVNEFVNKVWPFWMIVALCLAVLSLSRVWQRPKPVPILLVVLVCFLPASLQFIRQEGGTIPMVFCTSLTALLMMTAMIYADEVSLAAGVLVLAACATTKFEGIIHAALWGVFVMGFCWRRGWLKSRLVWRAILVALICMVPYFCLRLAKPVLHPESTWVHDGLASPGKALQRLPQTFFLNTGRQFFSPDFFNWETADKDHLKFVGKWSGIKSLLNVQMSLLPWLMLLLWMFTFWQKPRQRKALGTLAGILLVQFLILSSAISCLAWVQADVASAIAYAGVDTAGRYYYPFFLAGFLGLMVVWIVDRAPLAEADKIPLANPTRPAARSKKQR